MDRTSFRLVALVAAAFLVILCTDARADTTGTSQDSSSGATQTPATESTPDATPTAPDPATTDDPTAPAADLSVTQDPAADPATDEGTQATDPPADPPIDPTATDGTAQEPTTTDPAPTTTTPPADPIPPASDTEGQTSTALVVVSDDSSSTQHAVTAAPAGTAPPGSGSHGSGPGGTGGGLNQLLPTVEHQLHAVQGQIDGMQRKLDAGRRPSKVGLLRLRSSLAQIAPVLLALERRLDAAGQLTPHLRRILQRVRAHLSHTRASAAQLIAALRHSGVRGPELQLLLDQLVRFRALRGTLMPGPVLHPSRLPLQLLGPNAALQWSPSAWSAHGQSPATDRHATDRRASGSGGGGAPHHTPKLFSLPGVATVSSSGAGSAVAVALLATLLIGLAAPRLGGRLTPPPGRYRAVVFLAPLERPG